MINKLQNWYYNKLAKHKLMSSKLEDIAVHEILELYLTEAIATGNTARRKELAEMQSRVVETKKFVNFLKEL